LRSHETFRVQDAPLRPLLIKELWEILGGRALWTMLLLMCPLIGYSFFQAVSLYGEASAAGLQSPVLASSLSPLDGILVPTLGASYVAVTLLFPFVAIRALGLEKESGALRLLVQMPYRSSTLIAAKLAAVLAAWMLSSVPALSALAIWRLFGGHLELALKKLLNSPLEGDVSSVDFLFRQRARATRSRSSPRLIINHIKPAKHIEETARLASSVERAKDPGKVQGAKD
jgi:hypothetical protein